MDLLMINPFGPHMGLYERANFYPSYVLHNILAAIMKISLVALGIMFVIFIVSTIHARAIYNEEKEKENMDLLNKIDEKLSSIENKICDLLPKEDIKEPDIEKNE